MFALFPLFIHKEGLKGSLKLKFYVRTPPNPSLNKRGGNGMAKQGAKGAKL
jgi:hypothetical protein